MRQENQSRQYYHRPSNAPKHGGGDDMELKVELPPEAAHPCDFEQRQPKSAREQEPGELALRLAACCRKKGAGARQENKHRRAEMRDPAGHEQRGIGLSKVE